MVEVPITHEGRKDALETFPFSEFNAQYLEGLDNWKDTQHPESTRRWVFRMNGSADYSLEVRRSSIDNKHPELNKVTLMNSVNGGYVHQILNEVDSFSVGKIAAGIPGETDAVVFHDNKGGKIEIRNNGFTIAEKPTRVIMNETYRNQKDIDGLDT